MFDLWGGGACKVTGMLLGAVCALCVCCAQRQCGEASSSTKDGTKKGQKAGNFSSEMKFFFRTFDVRTGSDKLVSFYAISNGLGESFTLLS